MEYHRQPRVSYDILIVPRWSESMAEPTKPPHLPQPTPLAHIVQLLFVLRGYCAHRFIYGSTHAQKYFQKLSKVKASGNSCLDPATLMNTMDAGKMRTASVTVPR